MAAAASSARRSARTSQPPLPLAEEQAAAVLSQLEQRDIAAALRLSLHDSWNSDQEKSDAASEAEADSSSSEEEKENQPPAAAQHAEEWTSDVKNVEIPLPRLRPLQQAAPIADTPFTLLQRFLSPALMEEFAAHTNAAAPHDWRPTTAAELYAFIGVHLFMGIDRLPRTHMYWSETFGHSLITSLFSRDRFMQLLRFFRVAAADENAPARNPMPHVRALAEKLNALFAANFKPSDHLTLDEAMAAYKGRSPIKQYIPSKPHKWGYKIWCLCSEDYLLHFEVYEGKEDDPSDAGATVDTVLRMTAAYQHQERILYTDNWFTSPTLLHALAQRGIRFCGAVRSNRRGMPVIPVADIRGLQRGEWTQRQKGDTAVAVWRDRKVMWVLYNHCSPTETASLNRWNDAGRKVSIGCPRAVRDYFYHARSVDVFSQLHYTYLIGRKACRAWPRLAWWLLDACILNTFQLWSIGQHRPSQLRFREELMHELLKQLPSELTPRKRGAGLHPAHSLASEHCSVHADDERDCAVCSRQPDQRKRTRFKCAVCNAHLCLGHCFASYHS